jgi:hypothetical protein
VTFFVAICNLSWFHFYYYIKNLTVKYERSSGREKQEWSGSSRLSKEMEMGRRSLVALLLRYALRSTLKRPSL